MSKVIFLDAGHGGADAGAVNGTRYEKHDNLRLAALVQGFLEKQGCKVIMARTDDTYLSLAQRTNMANATGADLYISLHRNSFTNSTANGTEIWVYTSAGAVEVGAATEVLEQLAAVGLQSNRGIKKGNYHVCRESNMPAMLIELGFISNEKDNQLFDENFEAYAEAIAKGACAALSIPYGTNGDSSAKNTDTMYRVQVGAFTVKSNAERFLRQVRDMGLEAFLVQIDVAENIITK